MYSYVKRGLDIVISAIGLVIVSPLLVLVSIAIVLESRGPIIFKQQRLGKNGRVFNIYKFRSMVVNAEKTGVYSGKSDARVTKVGKIIRLTSLDELPQFVNILKGDMSLIGPRPALTYHPWPFEEYSEEQKQMFAVRPGVTGWAQVNGRKDVEWTKRIELNVWYVNHISFFLDMKILLLTIKKVLLMQDNYNQSETVKSKAKERER